MNKLLILITLLTLQSCNTHAPYSFKYPIEGDYSNKYACKDYNNSQNNLILFMVANPSNNSGAVYVSGQEFKAKYSVEGIAQEWRYSNNKYLIKLNPDCIAYYFNLGSSSLFETTVKSSAAFECHIIG